VHVNADRAWNPYLFVAILFGTVALMLVDKWWDGRLDPVARYAGALMMVIFGALLAASELRRR
jgi:hypothetical protein